VKNAIVTLLMLVLLLVASDAADKTYGSRSAKANSSSDTEEFSNVPVQKVNDPFERFNRTMFRVNDTLITYAIRPVAHGYAKVVPTPIRNSITNVFDNAQFPVRFINCVLQGKITRSAQETGKFVFNSIFGLGGIIRVSDHITGLTNVPAADFGQTLSVWGVSAGPYLFVPVLGPSDCRDVVGYAGDFVMYPLNWYGLGFIHHAVISNWVTFSVGGANFVNRQPKAVNTYDQIKSAAIDPYIAIRNGFLSLRAAQVKK
jgi:phospholipid-binding lipoprotein MlaA